MNAAIGSLAMCVSIELTAIRKSAACVPYSGCEGKNASEAETDAGLLHSISFVPEILG